VRRAILRSPAFVRAIRRLLKKQPHVAGKVNSALAVLSEDAFDPVLRTHKLRGDMEGVWACSVAYDLRLMFEIIEQESVEVIHLLSIGTHDELY